MLIHLIKHFFAIKTKKEQAKKSSQVCMIPFTIINQKGTSKKIIPGLYDPFYFNKPKRNKQKKPSQVCMIPFTIMAKSNKQYFHSYDTFYYNG